MPATEFQQALGKLVNDPEYRQRVVSNPEQLLSEYPLSVGELGVLMQVWQASIGEQEVQPYTNIYCCCCCCFVV